MLVEYFSIILWGSRFIFRRMFGQIKTERTEKNTCKVFGGNGVYICLS